MKEFRNRTAVVTGAAGGIGRALAEQCRREGMKIVIADIDREALARAETELKEAGAAVLAVPADVTKEKDVTALSDRAFDAFGRVDLLFNNAGVGAGGLVWEETVADWEWILGVNLWSVIYGIRAFVPRMIAAGTEGHIVNTASIAGLISPPLQGAYNVSKQGVVALSETLFHDLAVMNAKIGVTVLCPGFVSTGVLDCERNRPEDLRNRPGEVKERPEFAAYNEFYRQLVRGGIPPSEVAALAFDAIRENRFYIHTHPDLKKLIERRMEDILKENRPRPALKMN